MTFKWVLVLLMRFALPGWDEQSPEDFEDFLADLDGSMITDQFGRGSSVNDVVGQSPGKLSRGLHSVTIQKGGAGANQNIGVEVMVTHGDEMIHGKVMK